MIDQQDNHIDDVEHGIDIAVVGMAGRFPGADDIDALWRNIAGGASAVTPLGDQALRAHGISDRALADPAYVKSGILFDGMDLFDAGFFGYSPRDAEQLDPQQRVFLETAWQALEHAGHAGAQRTKLVGAYAGSGTNIYLLRHLLPSTAISPDDVASLLGLINGNDKDSLATRVAYKLDLRGPAVSVQTACSTSLTAVHLACRALLNHEADMALAGGVWLNLFQGGGYRYQAGAILSPDGLCRAFDERAAGTAIGSGAGVVVLKRLADALDDGDTIHALIKGSALNNDGAAKIGYTAPGVDGQAEVILAAQAMADVAPDSIGYVEAHGTGTALGDPIEIAALTQAFRAGTRRTGFCAIGSVKTNIGHLDAAAGVTGLIKAIMALKHRSLPPSLNFERPNPQIDFAGSPFYVNTEARPWPAGDTPRRAGVSSFGMGGTNVHVILEEAPAHAGAPVGAGQRGPAARETLLLSARSGAALAQAVERLGRHLDEHPEQAIADVAHTLRAGRKRFEHRAAVVARTQGDAIEALRGRGGPAYSGGRTLSDQPTVAFLFPGQGAQHPDMTRALYDEEPVFRAVVDHCCDRLRARLGLDLRTLMYPSDADRDGAAERLARTEFTQPALFAVEYALAQLWLSRGLRPDAMLGHSIGEYAAACVAGVFTLDDALDLVAARGQLVQSTPPGAMLAVNLPEAELLRIAAGCDLAAVNAGQLGVLSGTPEAIAAIERDLLARGVPARRLHVSHAFHSALLEPVLGDFKALVSRIERRAPTIPFVSNVSGDWIGADEACSAEYWVRQLRGTVRFADGLAILLAKPDRILLEVGPGDTLSSLARRQADNRPVLSSQCHPRDLAQNDAQLGRCVAGLWVAGVELDTAPAATDRTPRRVPLPTYPFERASYWVAAPQPGQVEAKAGTAAARDDGADRFYVPAWRRADPVPADTDGEAHGVHLILGGEDGFSRCMRRRYTETGTPAVLVLPGVAYERLDAHRYQVRPGEVEDFTHMLQAVEIQLGPVAGVSHLWCLDVDGQPAPDGIVQRGLLTLMALAQALDASAAANRRVAITVLANQVEDLTGGETVHPEKATLYGPVKVIPQEFPVLSCRLVDVLPPAGGAQQERLARQVVAEARAAAPAHALAYRGASRWTKTFDPVGVDDAGVQRLRPRGVYLITGGLGGIGLTLARHLAQHWQARLVLTGRSAVPPRAAWPALAADTDGEHAALARKLLELESLGAEVLVLQADVGDAAGMAAAVAGARERFGAIDGAIHAAGVAGGGMIAGRGADAVARVLAPKLAGTGNLMAALDGEALSFVLLCSSLGAIVGGFGQIDYCAANSYLDAYAAAENRRGRHHVVSVNWDTWRDVGMASGHQLPAERGIAPARAGTLFETLVNALPAPQVLVSTVALERQLAEACSTGLAERLLPEPVAKGRHARPELRTAYVPADSEFESDLAALWGHFLGMERIGIHDNFFELGGDSLLAIQLLARVRQDYGVDIHPAALFKNPTVAALAVAVETLLIEELDAAPDAIIVDQ